MYGSKKRLLKSMSTKMIDSKGLLSSNDGTPKQKYDEIILSPLSRTDFNMNIINNWIEVRASNSPRRRSFHTSFLYKEYLYIFGGKDISEGKLNDMWRVNINEEKPHWEEVKADKEFPSLAHHTGNEVNGVYYIIGGQNEFTRQTNNVYLLNLENRTLDTIEQKDNIIFPKTEMHSCNYYSTKNELIIFGGYSKGETLNTMYTFDIEKKEFTQVIYNNMNKLPLPRSNHSTFLFGDTLYIFGGSTKDGQLLNDLWKYDINTTEWTMLSPEETDRSWPKPRSGTSISYINNSIYLFGGKIGNLNEANDFWRYDMGSKQFTLIHDTLLEQYNKAEILELGKKDESFNGGKSTFKVLSKKEMEERKNPFSKNYSNRKSSLPKNLGRSQSTMNMKNKFEKEIFANSGFHSMKYSSIFTLDDKGVYQAIQDLNMILPFKIGKKVGDSLSGHVPLPRDGQSMNVFNNKLIIFGGDRNKYPFNDLFFFKV